MTGSMEIILGDLMVPSTTMRLDRPDSTGTTFCVRLRNVLGSPHEHAIQIQTSVQRSRQDCVNNP